MAIGSSTSEYYGVKGKKKKFAIPNNILSKYQGTNNMSS